jgi:hypothetical protein
MGKQGSHPASARAQVPVAHGVHPAVHGMQPGTLYPVLDRSRPDPKLEELASGDHAVLAFSKPKQRPVEVSGRTIGRFSPIIGVN